MKPAREPSSSRLKPCESLKKPHESCPFAAPCGPRRKKNDRGQRSAFFPSETSRFALSILAHRGSALPWLVNDRASLFPPPSPNLETSKEGFLWGGSDGVDHAAIEVLQHDELAWSRPTTTQRSLTPSPSREVLELHHPPYTPPPG